MPIPGLPFESRETEGAILANLLVQDPQSTHESCKVCLEVAENPALSTRLKLQPGLLLDEEQLHVAWFASPASLRGQCRTPGLASPCSPGGPAPGPRLVLHK